MHLYKLHPEGLVKGQDAAVIGHLQYQSNQRVATSEEAEHLILQGWKFVGILPNNKGSKPSGWLQSP